MFKKPISQLQIDKIYLLAGDLNLHHESLRDVIKEITGKDVRYQGTTMTDLSTLLYEDANKILSSFYKQLTGNSV